ncbi:FAD-binding oxidoreductase [Corynebacterium freiburgense]|uniref:FAD-binding oxidoreductase n=1 Tax=Corynebacterium freiburgense TaxID=556548 RepID=UPI001F0AA442|nr:FAD-binding oxidoreductase [Corynebacterium freiburgense]WJZ03675.1 putative FAD-linked oxidoreductase [Corynebacterium freiburgense]
MSAQLPIPPMAFNLWGTPDEAKPLSPGILRILKTTLGLKPVSTPAYSEADITLSESRLTAADTTRLAEIVGEAYISTEDTHRLPRARGKSYLDLIDWRTQKIIDAPDGVVAPHTEEEILAVLQYCSQEGIAVIPFGGGTSVVGGITPLDGGHRAVISLDLARFNEIEDVDLISGLATLGAGLSGPDAEIGLSEYDLQLGHFPQSFPYATIGGFAATRSAGQNSAGYGRFDEMVHSFTVVTPKGIMQIGGNSPASAAGPDLRELFLGSEGALGIITRVRCTVHPIPKFKRYEAFQFPDFHTGAHALRLIEQRKTRPTVIRLSDEIETSLNLATTHQIGSDAEITGCLCVTMYEGDKDQTYTAQQETRELILSCGGTSLGEGPARAWEQGRFGAPVLRDSILDIGGVCETLETATDWSNVEVLKSAVGLAIAKSITDSGTMAVVMCHISHVYPTGCSLYFTIIASQSDNPHSQWANVKRAASEAIVHNGGTITHHHSVGTDHLPYIHNEFDPLSLEILRAVKNTLDPKSILNPGKLII